MEELKGVLDFANLQSIAGSHVDHRRIWGLLLAEYWRMLLMLAAHRNRPQQGTCRRLTLMLSAMSPVRPHLQLILCIGEAKVQVTTETVPLLI